MRIFVFLLFLANLLFFAWTRGYFGVTESADAFRVGQQLRADQVRIISNDVPPPETARPGKNVAKPEEKASAEPAPAERCVQLAELPPAEADRLEAALSESLPGVASRRTNFPGTASFWVHIPPLKTKRDAENKAGELKNLGVKEYFIVQESGANQLAISLGLFSSSDAATAALAALREKGVRSARIAERQIKPAVAQLELRAPEANAAELDQWLSQAAPDARRNACKLRNASGQ